MVLRELKNFYPLQAEAWQDGDDRRNGRFHREDRGVHGLTFHPVALGSKDKLRPQWHHYYKDTNCVIYVVDNDVRNSVDETKQSSTN